jgi:ankyrin repeat protein
MRMTHRAALWTLPLLAVVTLGAAAPEVPLATAAKNGDAAAVRALLQKKVDVNAPEVDGTTALHWAVHKDALDIVDLLIRAGANVKAANRYGAAPLTLACTNGNAEIALRLLKAGADANTTLPGGETALMTAARTGKAEVLRALLAYGANPNARESSRGQTALMWAAAENNAAAMKVLIEGGADINARTADPAAAGRGMAAGGRGAAPVAGRGGAPAAARGAQPPVAATANGSGVFSGALGVAPAAAPTATRPSFSALMFAIQSGKTEAVQVLLEAGVSVNETLPDGTSGLVLATQNGNWELAAFLADRGANVDAAGQGWTALHQIARLRRTNIGFLPPPTGSGNLSSLDLARRLVAKGANVNAKMTKDFRDGYRNRLNRIGATPFLLAAKSVDTELMKVLLAAGADPMTPNADKTTALMVAAGVDVWNPGEDGGSAPDFEPEALQAVKMLVELGHDVNAVNDRGETALHGAAYRGANSIVEYLVSKGAKIDARSKQGWTPWTIANGVFYTLFFKEQPATAALLAKLMAERGISTEGMADEGRTCFDCGRNARVARDAEGTRVAQPAPAAVPGTK